MIEHRPGRPHLRRLTANVLAAAFGSMHPGDRAFAQHVALELRDGAEGHFCNDQRFETWLFGHAARQEAAHDRSEQRLAVVDSHAFGANDAAPRLCEHTTKVLREAGYEESELSALSEEGITR